MTNKIIVCALCSMLASSSFAMDCVVENDVSNDNTRKVFTAGDVYAYIDDDGTVEIPYGYTEIEPWAFHYALDVNNVIIPDTVENIGDGAFYGCIYLSGVVVPNSIQYIGEGVFLTTRNTGILVIGCRNDEDKNRMIDVINQNNSYSYAAGNVRFAY